MKKTKVDLPKAVSRAYNKRAMPQALKEGDLVLKAIGHVQKGLNASKFAPKLEGP